ncbi:MAG: hypothetical protein AAGL10_15010 [Pseudomonadota bacterium]
MKRKISGALIASAMLALSSQTALAQSNVSFICPKLDTATGELEVRLNTGCMTGMARMDDHTLQMEVNQHYAMISIEGDINFHPINSPIVTADCAGAQQVTLTASEIEARQYSVIFNGQRMGVTDMITDPEPDCISNLRGAIEPGATRVNRSDFADWSDDPFKGWKDWRNQDVIGLVQPLLAGHPETDSGLQTTRMTIDKRVWGNPFPIKGKPWSTEPFVAISIRQEGFRDDSVSGARYFIEMRPGEDGWRIENMFSQNLCARGQFAGQWTGERCS